MRLLVTGSREWTNRRRLYAELDKFYSQFSTDLTLVHGHCPDGADHMADDWALVMGLTPERHPADWVQYNKRAGHIRNAEMVRLGAGHCLAFLTPGCRGTVGCAALAQAAGIAVTALFASS